MTTCFVSTILLVPTFGAFLGNQHSITPNVEINCTLQTVVRDRLKLSGDSHSTLVQWGSHIHTDFVRNNAHLLTTSCPDSSENQVLQTMKLMVETNAQLRTQVAQQSEQMIEFNKTLTCMATTLLDIQNTMKQNTNFAVQCIASQATTATVAASVTSTVPPSPPTAGSCSVHMLTVHTFLPSRRPAHSP